jgi:integrase
MASLAQNPKPFTGENCDTVVREADSRQPYPVEEWQKMARRRFQDPKPFRRGEWWCLLTWQDEFQEGKLTRKRKWHKLAPATTLEREAKKIAAELLRPMNQGLISAGSAITFGDYVKETYVPTVLPLLANTTRVSYEGTLRKYLTPTFGTKPLRDMATLTLQNYFSAMRDSVISGDTVLKIKEVLSSVLGSAVRYDLLTKNPMLGVQIPRSKIVNKKKQKPHITPEEFERLVGFLQEPYATMICVAVYTGLRVSELIGLRWEDVRSDSLSVDERYCRGDWSVTKTEGSAAAISVDQGVIARILRLKTLEVELNWGGKGAKKRIKLVRSEGPKDLVFQSVRRGVPMDDQNILRRHLRPAAIRLGLDPKKATWRSLRTSCATWMIEAGADPKSVQGQMRHSRIGTTMDVYAQFVPESQRRAVAKTMEMVNRRREAVAQAESTTVN